jgi:non-specific serine/threonine protein kinase
VSHAPLPHQPAASDDDRLALWLSPHGQLFLAPDAEAPALAPQTAGRIREAFDQGPGFGLLHLGAGEVHTELAPGLAYFRDLARLFLTALCAVPDLDERRGAVEIEPPLAELDALLERAPPMPGAEYLDRDVLISLWGALQRAFQEDLARSGLDVPAYLQHKDPLWTVVGRVCLHLAENRKNDRAPFAFLATYATRVSAQARVQHLPLGQALREYAGAGNRQRLLSLLLPVKRAAERSPLIKQLVESNAIYHPLAWTPQEAYRFLKEVPLCEASGLVVRVPDWWQARRRPQVSVTIGERSTARLSMQALVDFDVRLTLDGAAISPAEWREILAGTDGLVLLKGQWVEIDRERLQEVLSRWRAVQREAASGLPFHEAMRLLSGAALSEDDVRRAGPPEEASWCRVQAGRWLHEILDRLRDPSGLGAADPGPALRARLRPYQQEGVRWLWFLYQLGLGACLADDMGLGKTIQVLALLLLLRQHRVPGPHLLVVPASLLANWRAEIDRFAPDLRALLLHPSAMPAEQVAAVGAVDFARQDLVITTYGYLSRLPVLAEQQWGLVVLDEAQAIKNPSAKQTRAAKALRSRVRLCLTGTPVENRLQDLWSLYDFICPGLLGPAKVFGRFARDLADSGNYAPLRSLVRPYLLRRLKSDRRIIADLPDKTEVHAFCPLSRKQAVLYQQAVEALAQQLSDVDDDMKRRGMILAFLLRFKQICNHPAQWLGSGAYDPGESGKFQRLRELCEPIAARQEKVLVFTQFREMTRPLHAFLGEIFGRPGLVLSGETRVKERMALVESFQQEGRGAPPYFVLSLKAGGTGLNLTAAAHVIHFDRWWNPAVEDQATDRAYRIGQRRNVLVHKFVCRGTIEERIDQMIRDKQGLSGEVLQGGGEVQITEMSNEQIMKLVSLDITSALAEA